MGTENSQQTTVGKTSPRKFGKIGIIVVVIVVAVVVVGGVYFAMNIGKGGIGPAGGGNSGVSSASSLQYTVSVTNSSGGSEGTWTYYAKNIGTSSLLMRIEYTTAGTDYIYVVNGVQQKVWVALNGFWVDESSTYNSQLNTWNNAFNGWVVFLKNYVGSSGSYTYHESNGQTVEFTNIAVNPSLSDSLFTH
jgi:hypothetical protein